MGYSTPKKQLDLKEFLSKPGNPRRPFKNWKKTAMPPLKERAVDAAKEKVA